MSDKEIIGFHGCDRQNVDSIRAQNFRKSQGTNHYSFLGEGAYFFRSGFTDGAVCARAWAQYRLKQAQQRSPGVTFTWAVLKVSIRPRNLLDGTTDSGKSFIHEARMKILAKSNPQNYTDENLLKLLAKILKIDVIIYDFWIKILENRITDHRTKFPNARLICVFEPESAIDKDSIAVINEGLCT